MDIDTVQSRGSTPRSTSTQTQPQSEEGNPPNLGELDCLYADTRNVLLNRGSLRMTLPKSGIDSECSVNSSDIDVVTVSIVSSDKLLIDLDP